MEASAHGEVWARGFQLEDQKDFWCVWSGALEGDFEGSWMVLGKKWRLKWEKALKSGFGLIFGVGVQCCPKDSRISSLWPLIGMRQ